MKLIIDFVLVIGIVLSILPIIGLLKLRGKSASKSILLVFWILLLNTITYFYASLHELSNLQFITNFLQDGVRLLIPPLLYVYVKSIFSERADLIRKNLKHFLVFFIYLFDYTIPKFINPHTKYIDTIHLYFSNWDVIQNVFGILYFLMTLRLFYRHRKSTSSDSSNIGEEGFLWMKQFLISFLVVFTVDLIITITEIAIGHPIAWSAYVTVFFLVAAIAYLQYESLTQASLFLPQFLIEDIEKKVAQQPSNSYLKLSEKENLSKRFNQCMRIDKMYLLQNLNSKSLANAMETSERKLSAFFNEVMDSNFYDAINSFRVEEAKKILQSDALKNQSITGIALSCGFRSKSSFYRIFKKSTHLSPTDYVKTATKASHHP